VQVDFYRLGSSPIERVLPRICERLIAAKDRLLIVARSDLLGSLDDLLWTYAREAFLPHGRAGSPGADTQPVLLADQPEPINGATHIALADGAWREAALDFRRCFYFFDTEQSDDALARWEGLQGRSEVDARYWRQDANGKWVRGP
jgi:DNA polymerase-3 subunit chi